MSLSLSLSLKSSARRAEPQAAECTGWNRPTSRPDSESALPGPVNPTQPTCTIMIVLAALAGAQPLTAGPGYYFPPTSTSDSQAALVLVPVGH